MKNFFLKISSISLALLVFFSSLSFAIHDHYCGGELIDSSLFLNAKACGSEMEQSSSSRDCAIQKNDCCQDKVILLKRQDELKTTATTILNLEQQFFVASFIYTYVNLFDGLVENIIPFRDYLPPLVTRRLFKLDETYLI